MGYLESADVLTASGVNIMRLFRLQFSDFVPPGKKFFLLSQPMLL
jgi:hypothetical protein